MAEALFLRLRSVLADDRLARMPLAAAFGISVFANSRRLHDILTGSLDFAASSKSLAIAATCSNLFFMGVLAWLTIVRRAPSKTAPGVAPKLYAFWGTFSAILVGVMPLAVLPDALRFVATAMVIGGAILAAVTAIWLGRSFSIVAQSRNLVTAGPYAIVRHPLYVCEQITIVGMMLNHLSWVAIFVVATQWYCQLKRMKYEEKILRESFPEYEDYAKATPALIPMFPLKSLASLVK